MLAAMPLLFEVVSVPPAKLKMELFNPLRFTLVARMVWTVTAPPAASVFVATVEPKPICTLFVAEYTRLGLGFDLLNERTKDYAVNDPVMDCFAKPVNMDILYNGKKVLGGALRKFGAHMLYQASFQSPDARSNAALHRNAVLKALGAEFGLEWEVAEIPEEARAKAAAIAEAKYRTPEWNERI